MANDFVPVNAERLPLVHAKDGEVFANSRDLAAFFEKEHRGVLRDIDNLLDQEADLGLHSFVQGYYTLPATGDQQHRCFDMDRTGFTLLAMGFTGTKALRWKLRYIEAFDAMESTIRRLAQSGPTIDLNDPAQLRGLLLNYAATTEKLERRVQELLPSETALDRLAHADGSLCITDAAKALQMRPKDLFQWLRQSGWIYKRAGGASDLGYQSKTSGGLLEHKVTTVLRADGSEKITEQVRVTAKGLTKLAQLVKPAATLL